MVAIKPVLGLAEEVGVEAVVEVVVVLGVSVVGLDDPAIKKLVVNWCSSMWYTVN